MGEAPDFVVGDRIDLMMGHVIVGKYAYELLFKGEITFIWTDPDSLDVRAGEQVFRVPRRELLTHNEGGSYFRPEAADEVVEIDDYNPEAEIDHEA